MRGLIAAAVLAAAPAAALDVSTAPHAVTVFPSGARVERTGSRQLPAGRTVITIPDIPAVAADPSIRLAVEGPAGTRVFGVQIKSEYTPEEANARRDELQKKAQDLQDRIDDLTDRQAAITAETDLLKALGQKAADRSANGAVGDFPAAAARAGTRLASLFADARRIDRQKRELIRQLQAVNQEMAQAGEGARAHKAAEAELDLATGGPVTVSVIYQVASASWSPLYDIRLESTGPTAKAAISFAGNVVQSTGEDWNNVDLTLSTQRPQEGTQIPDPTNWWLDRLMPQPVYRAAKSARSMAPAPAMARALSAESAREAPEPPEPAQYVQAQVVQSEFAAAFAIRGAVTVKSDGTAHRAAIEESKHPATVSLVTVPRLSQAVLIEARIKYSGEAPLMPGSANLFREAEFAGTTQLGSVAPGEEMTFGFGQDDRVKVSRKMMAQSSAGGSWFSKANRKYRWITTLHNFHPDTRTVEVREQLPRSRQKEIVVEPGENTPVPLPDDPERPGLLRWQVNLSGGQEQKINFGYSVKWPDDWQVSGLE